jgi:hypothetical protein
LRLFVFRVGRARQGRFRVAQRLGDLLESLMRAPVEEHGEDVRVGCGVLDLRQRQRPPCPVAALLSLVHVRAQHGGDGDGEAGFFQFPLLRERQ